MSKNYQPKPSRRKKPVSEPRQRRGDYRIFVGAFPTGELAEQIQKIREEIDVKTAQITPPHVTLAGIYWRNGKPTRANEHELIEKLDTISAHLLAFDLQLGGIQTFGERVIYMNVALTEPLLIARRTLINQMGNDKHRRFKPHLTLAMRLKQPAFSEVLTNLQESEWHDGRYTSRITELHLMQRGEADPVWRHIHTIPLK